MERLLKYFIPEHYKLELNISKQQETIRGTVTIDGRIVENNNIIKLHAVDMNIKNIKFQALHRNTSDITQIRDCEYKYDGQTIEIPLTSEMQTDLKKVHTVNVDEDYEERQLATFIIEYETKLNHNMQGCYISTYDFNGEPQKLIATQFESHYAREAFPCIDEPAVKATFDLTLIIPDYAPEDVVLANTPLFKQEQNRFTFAETPRMSTYLLAWVIGPLKSISTVNHHGVKVTSYCALNQTTTSLKFANEVAACALDYYDEKFGIQYPLEKLDQVALPDFEAGAMENWGLVTYRESCMLAEPNASIDTKQSVALTVTHELSHQWFGDLVTMAWWDDLWLNESFATIMEYYATDALYPEFQAWQDFFTGDCVAALRRDCLRGVQSVKQEVHSPEEIATLFDSAIVYAKGARLVLMLIRLMGGDNFYKGVHDYFQEFKYQNTIGDNLWDKLQNYADFNVKDLMHAWISQPGYPALQEARNGNQTWWAQQRFLIDGTTDDSQWPLPEVKDDMSGHYLIDLGTSEFQAKLANFSSLTGEQKLRLLIDRALLAKSGAAPSASLLDLLPKFTNEDAAVWGILLDIINDLKIFFPPESEVESQYRQFLRQVIHDRLHEIGTKSHSDDTSDEKRLRKTFVVVARFASDGQTIQQLAAQYDNNLSAIDAELRGNILIAKMMTSEAETFPQLLQGYQTENDPEIKEDILYTLSTATKPKNIATLMSLLENPAIVRPQDHYFLCAYMLRNHKTRHQTCAWIYSHWDYIVEMNGDKNVDYYPRCIANSILTREDAQDFYNFAGQHANDQALKRTFAMAKVSIESKLSLIQHESAAVHAKLQQLLEDK